MSVIQELHDSEINAGVQSFYDRCWTVWLGDDMNGFREEAIVESFDDAEKWLAEAARRHYPLSDYARKGYGSSVS